jgi:hypothetical protein
LFILYSIVYELSIIPGYSRYIPVVGVVKQISKHYIVDEYPLFNYMIYDINYDAFTSRYSLVVRLSIEKRGMVCEKDRLYNEQISLIYPKDILMSKWREIVNNGEK